MNGDKKNLTIIIVFCFIVLFIAFKYVIQFNLVSTSDPMVLRKPVEISYTSQERRLTTQKSDHYFIKQKKDRTKSEKIKGPIEDSNDVYDSKYHVRYTNMLGLKLSFSVSVKSMFLEPKLVLKGLIGINAHFEKSNTVTFECL